MKAHIITLVDDQDSVAQAIACVESHRAVKNDFDIGVFEATTAENVVREMLDAKLQWNYPFNGQEFLDMATGLRKRGYETADPKKRMACFMSHYRLWQKCVEENESMIVLEHDATWLDKFDATNLEYSSRTVISLNRPEPGATPRAGEYDTAIIRQVGQKELPVVVDVPYVFPREVPAGLPGNSAYYIKPAGAKKLIKLVKEFGAWPNDAIMCKQLMRNDLGCMYPYVTTVQKNESSTTL